MQQPKKSGWYGLAVTAMLLTVAALLTSLFWIWHVPPGVAVAFLGAVAVLISLRPNLDWGERTIWCMIITSLLLSEIQAIRRDRREADAAQVQALVEQKREFDSVIRSQGDDLLATLATEGAGFNATEQGQEAGFKNTAKGITKTLSSIQEAIENTRPHAVLRYLDQ